MGCAISVRVELLGTLRKALNTEYLNLRVPCGIRVRELFITLRKEKPQLADAINAEGSLLPTYLLFINGVDAELVGGQEYRLKDGDVLTLIPITHGGN